MTDIFAAFHPPSALKDLQKYEIGEVEDKKSQEQKDFEKGYRELRAKVMTAGLFNASPLYYTWKILSNFVILGASIACAVMTENFAVNMFGALLLGLFWQQCGWLAHDFLHHQIFRNRKFGDLCGVFIGDVCQGFSVQWWKSKHNAHHAVPNLHASGTDSSDGDPDIDTMPILAWTLRMAETAKNSSWGHFFIRWQAFLYFPVLLFARLSWAHQSWVFVFGGYGQHSVKGAAQDRKIMTYPVLEKLGLIIHYAWLAVIMYHMRPLNALAYFLVAQTGCGLMLALVFGLGHNGMAVYPADERPDFWKLQVSTTRNVTSNWFVDFFCGGLQFQVEHHLFPMLPRHNLEKVNLLVQSFCKEYGVSYHEADMITGNIEVLNHLSKVSAEFVREFPAI